jgi:S-phase kinase-associated protein 1
MSPQQILNLQNTLRPNSLVFQVERVAAEHSGVVRMLLKDFWVNDLIEAVIPISVDVSDACLARVFEWVTFWKNAPKASGDAPGNNTARFTPWDEEFFSTVDSDMLYEILIASNYLDIKPLYDMACEMVVCMIRGRRTDEIREILNIESDFTPEQAQVVREQAAQAYEKGAEHYM